MPVCPSCDRPFSNAGFVNHSKVCGKTLEVHASANRALRLITHLIKLWLNSILFFIPAQVTFWAIIQAFIGFFLAAYFHFWAYNTFLYYFSVVRSAFENSDDLLGLLKGFFFILKQIIKEISSKQGNFTQTTGQEILNSALSTCNTQGCFSGINFTATNDVLNIK